LLTSFSAVFPLPNRTVKSIQIAPRGFAAPERLEHFERLELLEQFSEKSLARATGVEPATPAWEFSIEIDIFFQSKNLSKLATIHESL